GAEGGTRRRNFLFVNYLWFSTIMFNSNLRTVGIIGYNQKIMENSTKITHTPEGQNRFNNYILYNKI
ncbi:MAG TPA: hypothetical protein DHM44_06125, partial [Flexistipes sinusarabici]|nr:hypothetical protein [Flexistipes sinusarabici]